MKYIVIGGSGFLGQHLVTMLTEKESEILVCDIKENPSTNRNVKFLKVDVTNKENVEKIPLEKEDIVIHLAANQYHGKVPKKNRSNYFHDVNCVGTKNILEHMKKNNCAKMVYFSTDMVYGKPQYLPVDTNHPQNPFGPYGQSKKESERICSNFRKEGMNITVFRPRMILGPGRLGILQKLFGLIEKNLPVPMIGNGMNHYQMISVFDCANAILKAIEKGIPNQEYNLGSKQPPHVRDLLQNLIDAVDSKSMLIPTYGPMVKGILSLFGSMGAEIMYKEQYMIADENYLVDIEKTEKELEWTPKYNDQDMINQAYKYYKALK